MENYRLSERDTSPNPNHHSSELAVRLLYFTQTSCFYGPLKISDISTMPGCQACYVVAVGRKWFFNVSGTVARNWTSYLTEGYIPLRGLGVPKKHCMGFLA